MATTASLFKELRTAELARARADADFHEANTKGKDCPRHVLQNAAERVVAAEARYNAALLATCQQEIENMYAMYCNRDYAALDAFAPVC